MSEVPLTQGYVALVDDEDFEELNRWKWQAHLASHGVYAKRSVTLTGGRKTNIFMHRQILGLTDSTSLFGDHINGDTLDNRRSNLREATPRQSVWNRSKYKNSASSYKGVQWNGASWTAKIKDNDGAAIFLGAFDKEEDAAKAYDYHALRLRGNYARLNFPNDLPAMPKKKLTSGRKLENWRVRAMRRAHEEAELSYKHLARMFGVSDIAVRHICRRTYYKDVR